MTWNKYLTPLFILAIHFSTFATTILLSLIILSWLTYGRFRQSKHIILTNQPALISLLLFILLSISTLYSSAYFIDSLSTLTKYLELLFPLILIPFLTEKENQSRTENFLLAALFISLFASYVNYTNIFPTEFFKTILKSRITYSIFISFLGFYCLHQLRHNEKSKKNWYIATALVIFNLFVICDGRTGQIIFLALCGLFFFQTTTLRTAIIASSLAIGLLIIFLLYAPPSARYIEGIHESINFYQNHNDADDSSMGLRLRFWSNTIDIIKQSILIGQGVGGLPVAFKSTFPHLPVLFNPHNEYLLITAQLGIIGLIIFVVFLASLISTSKRLPTHQRHLLQGVTCSLIISCIFNSPILDHTEGHWFMTLIALYSAPQLKLKNA